MSDSISKWLINFYTAFLEPKWEPIVGLKNKYNIAFVFLVGHRSKWEPIVGLGNKYNIASEFLVGHRYKNNGFQ